MSIRKQKRILLSFIILNAVILLLELASIILIAIKGRMDFMLYTIFAISIPYVVLGFLIKGLRIYTGVALFMQLITIAIVIFLALNTANGLIPEDSPHKKTSQILFSLSPAYFCLLILILVRASIQLSKPMKPKINYFKRNGFEGNDTESESTFSDLSDKK